ncbi:MAG: alpha-amylase family glycosyl hydrolase, partial [Myxococcota bacterium]
MLQGFHWQSHQGGNNGRNWYQEIAAQAQTISNAGFTHVWFPPPSDSAAPQGYLPRRLNRLDSAYGSENNLRSAISALSNRGVRSVADIVVNHRVGTNSWADFSEPAWPGYYVASTDEWNGPKSINGDTGSDFHAARDLDHVNPALRNDIVNWMNNRLESVGFS